MSFSRIIDLVLKTDAPAGRALVEGLNNTDVRSAQQFVQGDTVTCRIWPRAETGNISTPLQTTRLAAGTVIVLAGKKADALGATTLLYSATDFTEHNTAEDDTGDWYYEATLNFNTVNLAAAMVALSATSTSLSTRNDIELQNADNTERLTYQFDASVLRQVYGAELTPEANPDGMASQVEAEAGTDNAKWMSPLRTAQAIATLVPSIIGSTDNVLNGANTFNGDATFNAGVNFFNSVEFLSGVNFIGNVAFSGTETTFSGLLSFNGQAIFNEGLLSTQDATFGAELDVYGTLTANGNLTVTGNTSLGDASGDTATINAGTISAPNATSLASDRIANVGALKTAFNPTVLSTRGQGGMKNARFNLSVGHPSTGAVAYGAYQVTISSSNGAGGAPVYASAIVGIRKIYVAHWTVDFMPIGGANRLVLTATQNDSLTLDFTVAIVNCNIYGNDNSNCYSVEVVRLAKGYDDSATASADAAWSAATETRTAFLDGSQALPAYSIGSDLAVAGGLTVNGNSTLGDASGDAVTINAGTLTAANATDVSSNRLANVGALATVFEGVRTTLPLTSFWSVTSATPTLITGMSFSHQAYAGFAYEFFLRVQQITSGTGVKVQIASSSGTGFGLGSWAVMTREDTGAIVAEGDPMYTLEWAGAGTTAVRVRGNFYLNPVASATTVTLLASSSGGGQVNINAYECIFRRD